MMYIYGVRNAAIATKWFVERKVLNMDDEKLNGIVKKQGVDSPDNLIAPKTVKLHNLWWGEVEKRCPKVKKRTTITFEEWWDLRMRFYRQNLPDECYLAVERKHSCWEYWTPGELEKYLGPPDLRAETLLKKEREEPQPENQPAEGL